MHVRADLQVRTKARGGACRNELGGGSNGASVEAEECLDKSRAGLGIWNKGEISVVEALVHNDGRLSLGGVV